MQSSSGKDLQLTIDIFRFVVLNIYRATYALKIDLPIPTYQRTLHVQSDLIYECLKAKKHKWFDEIS